MIYRSRRVGLHGREFDLLKFRTMRVDGGSPSAGADDKRLTRIGRFLRRHKLDELPTLINVLKGDIALIGPRPTVSEVIYDASVSEEERRIILSVRQGLIDLGTCWNSNEDERLRDRADPHRAYMEKIYPTVRKLQIYGILHRSWLLDIRIILRTAMKVLHLPFFKIRVYVGGKLFVI